MEVYFPPKHKIGQAVTNGRERRNPSKRHSGRRSLQHNKFLAAFHLALKSDVNT